MFRMYAQRPGLFPRSISECSNYAALVSPSTRLDIWMSQEKLKLEQYPAHHNLPIQIHQQAGHLWAALACPSCLRKLCGKFLFWENPGCFDCSVVRKIPRKSWEESLLSGSRTTKTWLQWMHAEQKNCLLKYKLPLSHNSTPLFSLTATVQIWLTIFGFLPPKIVAQHVALVCHRFHSLTEDELLWKHFCLLSGNFQKLQGHDWRKTFMISASKHHPAHVFWAVLGHVDWLNSIPTLPQLTHSTTFIK